ncbi:hypothetical protein HPB48_008468 [Haemaphysalis longicornis]|uniref:Ig-like domain-containing protein n=1 Tax=Haemaphysalis longicornis TaxID=44386 RepID=A0A9J6FDP5_HAELO|nr:hypothetical protein HPB48_008468 [Haemaphysalis longicornis]
MHVFLLVELSLAIISCVGRPVIMPFSFPKNAVLRQKTTITCVVSSGAGPFQFVWTHEGNSVASDSRKHVKILSESVAALTIEAISAEDLGNYTCTASNSEGRTSLLRRSFHRR